MEVEHGGYSTVSRGTYEGREVAIKIAHVQTNNLEAVLKVSVLSAPSHSPERMHCRVFAERRSPGSTFDIQTYYRCLELR